jgi:hypothetical protein
MSDTLVTLFKFNPTTHQTGRQIHVTIHPPGRSSFILKKGDTVRGIPYLENGDPKEQFTYISANFGIKDVMASKITYIVTGLEFKDSEGRPWTVRSKDFPLLVKHLQKKKKKGLYLSPPSRSRTRSRSSLSLSLSPSPRRRSHGGTRRKRRSS